MSQEHQSLSAAPSPNESIEMTTAHQQPCVLLVEDDRSVRRYLEVTLQRTGYQVMSASDGLQAMKIALANEIDVVVTDAVMPNLSGQQLARFLRNNPKLAHIPIVLLTGQENKPGTAAPDNPIDVFLYKPISAGELVKCLASLLQKS